METGSYIMDGEDNECITRSVSLFTPVTALILLFLDPIAIANLLKDRQQFEIEMDEKQIKIPTMIFASWRTSVDSTLLDSRSFMGQLEDIAPNAEKIRNFSNEQAKACVNLSVTRSERGQQRPRLNICSNNGPWSKFVYTGPRGACPDLLQQKFLKVLSSRLWYASARQAKNIGGLVSLQGKTSRLQKKLKAKLSFDDQIEKQVS